MNVSRRVREAGARVEFADLGDWGGSELYSEYDPKLRVIRVNRRNVERLHGRNRRAFIASAVAHELYHHLEHVGALPRTRGRTARERAADAFARDLTR